MEAPNLCSLTSPPLRKPAKGYKTKKPKPFTLQLTVSKKKQLWLKE